MKLSTPSVWFVICVSAATGGLLLERHARNTVISRVCSGTPGAKAVFKSFSPSASHFGYFTYRLENVPELSTAHWRLRPLGGIEVEK